MPQIPHDDAPSSFDDRHADSLGADTTSDPSSAQAQLGRTAPPRTVTDHEVIATVGRDRSGRAIFLARPLPNAAAATSLGRASLIVVRARAAETDTLGSSSLEVLDGALIASPRECYVCGTPRGETLRFCEVCSAALAVFIPNALDGRGMNPSLDALQAAIGTELTVIGEMPVNDGRAVYFVREEQAAGVLLALVPRTPAAGTALTLDAIPAIDAIHPSLAVVRERSASAPAVPGVSGALSLPETIASTEDPLIGSVIDGKYRILRLLGQGGMGRVFAARHEQLLARRAIKVMHADLLSRTDLVTRFYEEARNAARVKHDHICSVHDFGASDGLIYIAMELIDGEALSALLKRGDALSPARVADIIAQTASALDAAHALRIIHRDVKPDNIMLCRHDDGRDDVKVVDFGISKALNRSELTLGGQDTVYGVVIGTLKYMSDEQRQGQEIDSRTDVYALGRTAVEMLFRELPDHAAWAEWSSGRVPPALRAVLSRALASRNDRYATAGEFSRDLSRVLAQGSSDSRNVWRERWASVSRRRAALRLRPGIAISVLGSIALLAAVAIVSRSLVERSPRVSPPQAPKTKDTASAGGGVRIPACTSSPTVLAEIRRLTDPVTGTVDGARRVVGLVPTLALCSDVDQVEAQLRLAEAYFTLSQSTRACAVLRRIEPQAAATPFAANVGLYLSHCR